MIVFTKLKDPVLREWYFRACLEHGWSRAVLEAQIETRLHERQDKAITNFNRTLPAPMSELAQQLLKDPYNFDFLTLHDEAVERDLERGCWTICSALCWNSAPALPSLAANTGLRSAMRTSSSTCFSTIL